MKKIAVAGAGLSGAVIAYELALTGAYEIDVFEARSHVAGNCHAVRDADTGILIHNYGPHIFHTNNERVWNYVRQFDEFMPFTNRVKAITQGRVFSLPINLLTINQFFGKTFSPTQAQAFLESVADTSIAEPKTFEEQALRFVGHDLYEAFFKGYTIKQWGMHPSELPASILKRLPVRFNYDDNYYTSIFQGIPRNGYTYIVEKMLDHPAIKVHLNTPMSCNMAAGYSHLFYSGPIDGWFDYSEGRLGYRTLNFVEECYHGDFQGNAVINYGDIEVPWTRISEHKHFVPWESHDSTVIFKEYSRFCKEGDTPYYPIRLVNENAHLTRYIERANAERHVTFIGRLGTYRYLDMDDAIAEALTTVEKYRVTSATGKSMPAFMISPI